MSIWVVLVLIVIVSVGSYIFGKHQEHHRSKFIGSLMLVRDRDMSDIEAYMIFSVEPKELKPGEMVNMIVSLHSQENQGS